MHGDFWRLTKRQRSRLPFQLKENDFLIVCGDFGLLWKKDREFQYNLKWLSNLPFKILWIPGNHENYNMMEEYPIEQWCGGKVRHIARNKIILLERGQIFAIEDKTFFAFGGASSHDIAGGILDRNSPAYKEEYKRASRSGKPFRILNESWWEQELPTHEEMQEGRNNLVQAGYRVDYVITHCMSGSMQRDLECYYIRKDLPERVFENDILTDYFDELEQKLQYKYWFCGHYHVNVQLNTKHRILYENVVSLSEFE